MIWFAVINSIVMNDSPRSSCHELLLDLFTEIRTDKEKFRIVIKSTEERFSKLDIVSTVVKTPNLSLTEDILNSYNIVCHFDSNFGSE